MTLAASAAGAVTYNAVTDFSITNGNANGVWSYYGGNTLLDSTTNYMGVLSWHGGAAPDEASVTSNQVGLTGPPAYTTIPYHAGVLNSTPRANPAFPWSLLRRRPEPTMAPAP